MCLHTLPSDLSLKQPEMAFGGRIYVSPEAKSLRHLSNWVHNTSTQGTRNFYWASKQRLFPAVWGIQRSANYRCLAECVHIPERWQFRRAWSFQ